MTSDVRFSVQQSDLLWGADEIGRAVNLDRH